MVEGFRSSHFGMTEAEVRQSIVRDFGIKPETIQREVHPVEQTTILAATVKNLIPESGEAVVVYVLGYKSKKLTQVNVVWARDAKAEAEIEKLKVVTLTLRNYFAARQYQPDSIVRDRALSDGGILVFRGADEKGRVVTLVARDLAPVESKGQAKGDAKTAVPRHPSVQISYIEKPKAPDVYQIRKGDF
ncbi:MAG: hypothetical protein H7841_05390 [Magnetospirillum sp. WYHS-4]